MIKGLHHASITTGDLDRLIAFYRDQLGFQVVFEYA
jgi:catechol 2,3-dioxygenase-like lactoylglutathione lyase family enzyme